MHRLAQLLEQHGLTLFAVLLATGIMVWTFWRRPAGTRPASLFVIAALLACFAFGALALPPEVGMWTAGASVFVLSLAFVIVLISGSWSYYFGLILGVALSVGLGGFIGIALSRETYHAAKTAVQGEFASPWWLLTLAFIPAVVYLSFRSLAGLGPVRRWIAIGIRCALIAILALALAELRLRKSAENLTVLFVVDNSISVPEIKPKEPRFQRIAEFIKGAVGGRGSGHELDQAGIIVFGRRPRLSRPPSDDEKLLFSSEHVEGVDVQYTDIGGAIKLALASFPESASKRIILFSDGNENLGNAEEQARLAKLNGVQIDVVPLAAGYKNENEVLIQSVEAPPLAAQSTAIPIRVVIRSHNPKEVWGDLTVERKGLIVEAGNVEARPEITLVPIRDGPGVDKPGRNAIVRLKPGVNTFLFTNETSKGAPKSYTYEAKFLPKGIIGDDGTKKDEGLAGDRGENNTASAHVIAQGQRRVLFIETDAADAVRPDFKPDAGAGQPERERVKHTYLRNQFPAGGKGKFELIAITPKDLPTSKGDLGRLLSAFDCVVLANVPREFFTADQMEMIRANTYEQGCGLVMIGGPDSFGSGGWQDSPVEQALPVDCDIKKMLVAGKGGLVLIFHGSEVDMTNRVQREVAKLAVKKLSPIDMLGIVYWYAGTDWLVKFQTIGGNKSSMLSKIDKLNPGDMPDCTPSLEMAHDELTRPQHQLATRHIIFISDADHWGLQPSIQAKLVAAKIKVSTVCIGIHSTPGTQNRKLADGRTMTLEMEKMEALAKATGGNFYAPKDTSALPAIYTQEARIVSQSYVHLGEFKPLRKFAEGPAQGLPENLPELQGFNRTTKKPSALASSPILGPSTGDQEFPILSYWHYGLGKAVAFTSDARSQRNGFVGWDTKWANSEMYLKFWEQVFSWAMRSGESGNMTMRTEQRDGKVKVIVEASKPVVGPDGKVTRKAETGLRLQGGVTAPSARANGGKPIELDFKQTAAGTYEAEFKADEAGSYFLNASAKQTVEEMVDGKKVVSEKTIDGVRSGVTIPYSPEFADVETNIATMKRLAEITGGNVYAEDDEELKKIVADRLVYREAPVKERSFQAFWFWLILIAGLGLLLDVAVRRIAIEPAEASMALSNWWNRLRGRRVQTAEGGFLDRLRSRKSEVAETIDRERATRRFEGEAPTGAAPAGATASDSPAPMIRPTATPASEEAGDDFAARMMRAKRKALEDREKKSEE